MRTAGIWIGVIGALVLCGVWTRMVRIPVEREEQGEDRALEALLDGVPPGLPAGGLESFFRRSPVATWACLREGLTYCRDHGIAITSADVAATMERLRGLAADPVLRVSGSSVPIGPYVEHAAVIAILGKIGTSLLPAGEQRPDADLLDAYVAAVYRVEEVELEIVRNSNLNIVRGWAKRLRHTPVDGWGEVLAALGIRVRSSRRYRPADPLLLGRLDANLARALAEGPGAVIVEPEGDPLDEEDRGPRVVGVKRVETRVGDDPPGARERIAWLVTTLAALDAALTVLEPGLEERLVEIDEARSIRSRWFGIYW
jgi:hypothetical protein